MNAFFTLLMLSFFATATAIPSFLSDNSTVALFRVSATHEKAADADTPATVSRTFSFLRGADPQTLELCVAAPESCPDDLLLQLEFLVDSKGIPMIADVLLINFCLHSPFASSLDFCADRDAKAMRSHLFRYKDDSYTNEPLLACVRDEPNCHADTRTHLDNLLLEPEVMNPIQQIVMFVCRHALYRDQLASCAINSGLVQWKVSQKLSKRASKLPAVHTFQFLRGVDVVQLAHCAADKRLCPAVLASKLDDLSKHRGMIEVSDAMIVAFCKYSPLARKLVICREHDSDKMVAAMTVYKDKEYGNRKIAACIKGGLDSEHCQAQTLHHLQDLMKKPEMLVPIQHMVKFFCQSELRDSLAACVEHQPQQEILAKPKYSVILDRARKAITMEL